jgi:hypothetical protein
MAYVPATLMGALGDEYELRTIKRPAAVPTWMPFREESAPSGAMTRPPGAPGVGALGASETDLIGMMKETYATVKSASPFLEFIGNHPMLTFTIIILAIVLGGAAGGYIGAGYKMSTKRNPDDDEDDEEDDEEE